MKYISFAVARDKCGKSFIFRVQQGEVRDNQLCKFEEFRLHNRFENNYIFFFMAIRDALFVPPQ